ncbi:MAG: hypothetical protein WCA78_00485 [Rhizomicrobium sp.]
MTKTTATALSDLPQINILKRCPFCAEQIQADAKVCRFCSRSQVPNKPSHIGRVIGISAAVIVGIFVAIIFIGSHIGPGSFNGTNNRLYEAVQVYSTGITNDEADRHVDEIAQAADISHSEAEDIAISFARAKIDPSLWTKLAKTSATMARLKRDGVIP